MPLPLLDLSRLSAPAGERAAFLRELREAARIHGFFYLAGQGIPAPLLAEVRAAARAFFALPEAEKLAIQMVHSPQFRGYNRAGLEFTQGRQDWREQVDFGPEEAAPALHDGDPVWKRLIGPNQWPAALPRLRPAILDYQAAARDVAIRVVRAFAEGLGQDPDVFAPVYEPDPNYLLKIVRYPGRDGLESDQGVGAHKDSGFVTLLLQDEVGGLQVQGEDGWIDAPPIEGTFVVNVGELLEMATDGYLLANVHRVVSPPGRTDRFSIPFFMGARFDATVPVLELPAELAAGRRGVSRDPSNPLFREVAQNYLKSRLRSHPDVARRHHADLLGPDQRAEPTRAAASS